MTPCFLHLHYRFVWGISIIQGIVYIYLIYTDNVLTHVRMYTYLLCDYLYYKCYYRAYRWFLKEISKECNGQCDITATILHSRLVHDNANLCYNSDISLYVHILGHSLVQFVEFKNYS